MENVCSKLLHFIYAFMHIYALYQKHLAHVYSRIKLGNCFYESSKLFWYNFGVNQLLTILFKPRLKRFCLDNVENAHSEIKKKFIS